MSRPRKPKQFADRPTCGGKRCYPHKHEAETVKAEQEIIMPELELSVYRCLTCNQWHLTRTKSA